MNDRRNRNSKSNKSNKKRALSKPVFILGMLSFAAVAVLGFFRFNASLLEYRLSSIERSIEEYTVEEIELKQSLSSLTSPIKIYSYCKDRLGMYAAKQEVVMVPGFRAAGVAAPEPPKGWRASMFAFFGLTVN